MLSRVFTVAVLLVACWLAALAQDVQVGVLEPWERADRATPTLKAITLAAPRNGFASGAVLLQAAELKGIAATMSDLAGPGGAVIPAAAVNVRYGQANGAVYPLFDAPIEAAGRLVVWARVNVPETAKPGAYGGTLTVAGATVPVALTVYDWRLGNPSEWTTWCGFLQSPESVAGYYKVPMWSDEHFALLEKSFALLAECGNDYLSVQAVGPSYWGDDPVIVFRKAGDAYVPDFTYLDRYLASYDRIVGKPRFLCVQAWSWHERGPVEPGDQPVMIHVLEDGKLVRTASPAFGQPGTEATWRAVFDGVRERVRKLGWRDDRILIGTAGDSIPLPATVDFFKKVAPWASWRVLTHGQGAPKWGWTNHKRIQPNGMRCDLLEIARWVGNGRPKVPDFPVLSNSRDHVGTDPFPLFALAGFSARGRYEGFCDKGLDYWTYTTAAGQKRNALNTYLQFGNVIGSTPRALSAPGPDGAMRTPVTEMVREGTQVQEAVYRIQQNLETLYPTPMKRLDMAEIFLKDALRFANATPDKGGNLGAELEVNFIFDGDTVRVLPSAPRWNTGGIGTGTAQVAKLSADGATFSFDFTLRDDPWVKGGSGRFDVTVALKDGEYTGTYKGEWKGVPSEGPVRGGFRPKGYVTADGPAPEKNALQLRCEQAIREYHEAVNLDARVASPLRAELRRLFTQVYALAEETTALAAGK